VRVRPAVRDEDAGGAAVPFDLELRLQAQAALEQHARDREGEDEVARTATVGAAPATVDPADRLRVDAETAGEEEAAAVHAAGRDRARAAGGDRRRDPGRGGRRVAGQAERAREDARAAAGHEAERRRTVEPVHDLVVRPV